MDKSINNEENIYNAKTKLLNDLNKLNEKSVPILRGCPNSQCFVLENVKK